MSSLHYHRKAEQSPSQQEEKRMVSIILANIGTLVCFRSGSPMDEELVLPLFKSHLEAGEILSLQPYNFYIRLAAIRSQEPLSGETLLVEDKGYEEIAIKVIEESRKIYAVDYKTYLDPEEARSKFKTGLRKDKVVEEPTAEVASAITPIGQ